MSAEVKSKDENKVSSSPLKILVIVLIGLILLVVVGIIAGFYYLNKKVTATTTTATTTVVTTTTTAEISNPGFVTYINDKYDWKIKYPSSWYVYDKGFYELNEFFEPKKFVEFSKTKINTIPGGTEYFPKGLAVNQMSEGAPMDFAEFKKDTSMTWSDTEIGGIPALKGISNKPTEMAELYLTAYYFKYQGKIWSIEWQNIDAKGSHDPKYDDMIVTFEFTK